MRGAIILTSSLALAIAGPVRAGPKPKPGFEPVLPPTANAPRAADGSIFNVSSPYAPLIDGNRAHAIGDPLTILLIENTTASKTAASKTDRSGGFSITPPSAGLFSFLNPNALKAAGQSSFKGQGNANQTSTLAGEVAVTIAEVRSNGTALIRGEKRLLLSQGQEWIQFAGIVRLKDIGADNRIESSRVADARIEYAGNGAVTRASREGWLSRFFNAISPF